MVERTTSEMTSFKGFVIAVNKRDGRFGPEYDINMKPEGIEIKGPTGCFHEFLRIPDKATETSVPDGSVLDVFLKELESIMPEVKNMATVDEALGVMNGKRFEFRKKQLGKAFEGHQAASHWVPVNLLADE